MKTQNILLVLASLLLMLCAACKQHDAKGPKYSAKQSDNDIAVYRLAVHPLHNPAKLIQMYQPLIDHLNNKIPNSKFELEASRDYPNYEDKIRQGHLAFLIPNPWQTIEAMKFGYQVIAMVADKNDFRGIIIVRKDSKISTPRDLKGKAVSYPAATAIAACMMPQYYFHTHGLDVNKDIENRFVGTQESSIMNVYLGQTAAGGTWPPPWRKFQKDSPKEAAELKVMWETEPLINLSVMSRKEIPVEVQNQVRAVFTDLVNSPEGRAILTTIEMKGFTPATDKDYEVVRSFTEQFEKNVRKVENK